MQLIKNQYGIGYKKQQGFTLIEVLVSVLLASVGLIGIAGLQISSVNMATVAYTNTQASMAMQDMVGLLRSSPEAAKSGNYNIALKADDSLKAFGDIGSLSTGATQADKSVHYWFQNLDAVLPNVKAEIACSTAGSCKVKVQYANVDGSTNSSTAVREQIIVVKI